MLLQHSVSIRTMSLKGFLHIIRPLPFYTMHKEDSGSMKKLVQLRVDYFRIEQSCAWNVVCIKKFPDLK
eukprot:c33546_g1_i1 orf=62-268(+)